MDAFLSSHNGILFEFEVGDEEEVGIQNTVSFFEAVDQVGQIVILFIFFFDFPTEFTQVAV